MGRFVILVLSACGNGRLFLFRFCAAEGWLFDLSAICCDGGGARFSLSVPFAVAVICWFPALSWAAWARHVFHRDLVDAAQRRLSPQHLDVEEGVVLVPERRVGPPGLHGLHHAVLGHAVLEVARPSQVPFSHAGCTSVA